MEEDGLVQRLSLLWSVLKQARYFVLGAVAVQLCRLFVLPGATQRRKRLAYLVANYGKKAKGLPEIPDVERLSSRVVRVMGLNPGPFTLQGSNTYLVGSGRNRILVDSGDGKKDYLNLLESVLSKEGATLSKVVITHEHEDHTGGISNLRKAFPAVKIWKRLKTSVERDPTGQPYDGELQNGTVIAEDGATLRAILTPGHTRDHVSLYLEEEGSIFSGDCVLGSGTAVFEDLFEYVGSLRVLEGELEAARSEDDDSYTESGRRGRIYPGHGVVVEKGLHQVRMYLAHRQLREDQILSILSKNQSRIFSEDELVNDIYADQNLSWILKRGAKRSVHQHLIKLLKENLVEQIKRGAWRLRPGVAVPQRHLD